MRQKLLNKKTKSKDDQIIDGITSNTDWAEVLLGHFAEPYLPKVFV